MSNFNDTVIKEFRANKGKVGHGLDQFILLLLHTIGAKSGAERVTPLAAFPADGSWIIVASSAGSDNNPAWYHNILAQPDTVIELGTETIEVTASTVTGIERDTIYDSIAERFPNFEEYRSKTDRVIPLVRLTPR